MTPNDNHFGIPLRFRQLLDDKKQLEMNILNTNQKAQRMSQNVEQLQWRIKDKCESNLQYVIDETDPLLR